MLDGFATGFAMLALLRPVAGLQLYDVEAPLAVSVVLLPAQIVVVPLTVITGIGFTVTVTVEVPVQEPCVPLTVYVVVDVGDATGLAIVALLSVPAGLHVYDVAPDAFSVVLPPLQMPVPPVTVITGNGVTVTVTLAVAEQPEDAPLTVYVVVAAGVAIGFATFGLLKPVVGVHA